MNQWSRFRPRGADVPVAGSVLLKRGIVLFWSVWVSVVVLTNIAAEIKSFGVLPDTWPLASGNYGAIARETSRYGVPGWLDQGLLAGVIVWEAVAALLLWRAFRHYWLHSRRRLLAGYTAFAVLLALFATFILADEVLHAFRIEGDHRGIAVLLLASLLSLQLLPDRDS